MAILHPRLPLPLPRLLPITMLVMVTLLVMKSGSIVFAATGAAAVTPPKAEASHATETATKPVITAVPVSSEKQGGLAAVLQPTSDQSVTSSELALLTDLRRRRIALDMREAMLGTREGTLAAVEKRLSGRVNELTVLQSRLEGLEHQRKERDETNWRGLVKLYETMKAKDAALIFNDLDLPVLLPLLDRMKEAKAAAIMAALQPDRARQVTTEMAQMRAKANRIEALHVTSPGG